MFSIILDHVRAYRVHDIYVIRIYLVYTYRSSLCLHQDDGTRSHFFWQHGYTRSSKEASCGQGMVSLTWYYKHGNLIHENSGIWCVIPSCLHKQKIGLNADNSFLLDNIDLWESRTLCLSVLTGSNVPWPDCPPFICYIMGHIVHGINLHMVFLWSVWTINMQGNLLTRGLSVLIHVHWSTIRHVCIMVIPPYTRVEFYTI